VRRGTARRSMVRRSGLGWDSPVLVIRGGLGEVCCVRATLGLSGRSWCVLACCGNARQQRECGGRGNSPLCGQGGLGGVCFCASGCGSFGLRAAVAVRLVTARRGWAVLVSHGTARRGRAGRSRLGAYRSGSVRFGMAVRVCLGKVSCGVARRFRLGVFWRGASRQGRAVTA